MGVIPATGAVVRFPTRTLHVSFDGDQISGIHDADAGPDAGLPGILKALRARAA